MSVLLFVLQNTKTSTSLESLFFPTSYLPLRNVCLLLPPYPQGLLITTFLSGFPSVIIFLSVKYVF